jgi:hypothetical protein
MTRCFDLYSILAITHRLPSSAEAYEEIITFMIDGPFTVSTLNVMLGVVDDCREELFRQHPQLHSIPPIPFFDDDEQAMDDWCDSQKARLGVTALPVEPLRSAKPSDQQE